MFISLYDKVPLNPALCHFTHTNNVTMASHLRVKANTTMNRKETSVLAAKSCDRCLTCDRRLIGYFAAVSSNIILPTVAPIIAPTSQIRVLGYEFEADKPLLDFFERDTRSPRT